MRLLTTIGILLVCLSLQGCWEAAGTTALGGLVVYKRHSLEKYVSDQDIESQINNAYFKNGQLWEHNRVIVSSVNHYVLLAGQVRTAALKQKALQLAQNVKSINRLYNEISVGKPIGLFTQMKDAFVTSVIKCKMLVAENFDPSSVKVITDNGTVYLLGVVGPEEADRAADIASKSVGVHKVVKVFQYIT